MKGNRKVLFGAYALAALLGGLWLCAHYGSVGQALFAPFATTVGAVVTAIVAGNVGEHLANKGVK